MIVLAALLLLCFSLQVMWQVGQACIGAEWPLLWLGGPPRFYAGVSAVHMAAGSLAASYGVAMERVMSV